MAFCSEIPLICSNNRLGLRVTVCVSQIEMDMTMDVAELGWVKKSCNEREDHGDVRVGDRLDSVIPCIHEQLNVPSSQARNTLSQQS